MTTRVFVVDDHELVRRGLIELINTEDDLSVVGQAGDEAGSNSVVRLDPFIQM
jgi:DNA-binding NarL/FixJ family response regulator